MGRLPMLGVVSLASVVLLVVAACGAASRNSLPLTARVIGRGEFRGYTPGDRLSFSSPKVWVAGDSRLTPAERDAEIERLTGEGFKNDLTQFLNDAQGPRTGLSSVMQLGSAASARAELAAQLRNSEEHTQIAERFPVKTIPGAVGYGSISPAQGGENVLFTDGPFLYLEGYGWYGTAHYPKHSALIAVATKLYARVHGHPAG